MEATKTAHIKGRLLWLHAPGVELRLLLLHASKHVRVLGLGRSTVELTEAPVVGGLLGGSLATSVECC